MRSDWWLGPARQLLAGERRELGKAGGGPQRISALVAARERNAHRNEQTKTETMDGAARARIRHIR